MRRCWGFGWGCLEDEFSVWFGFACGVVASLPFSLIWASRSVGTSCSSGLYRSNGNEHSFVLVNLLVYNEKLLYSTPTLKYIYNVSRHP